MFYNVSSGSHGDKIEAGSFNEAAEKFFYKYKKGLAKIIIVKEVKKTPATQYFATSDFESELPVFKLAK